jgi:hypothetical protein
MRRWMCLVDEPKSGAILWNYFLLWPLTVAFDRYGVEHTNDVPILWFRLTKTPYLVLSGGNGKKEKEKSVQEKPCACPRSGPEGG